VVRKQFLEPITDIRQEVGLFSYNGTWVAANLHITPPTPQSHPDLCFWDMGMTSEDVYDLFWPEGWHFCSPPGKATACGRFGPRDARFWRHEFAEPNWNDSKNAVKLLWDHLDPLITRDRDNLKRPFPTRPVAFPQDCIDIRRCRPFTFCQKVVNKWFHNRTILIGDAAHVFPPFGGQGIACGIRDGDSLAWRLAVLCRINNASKSATDKMLQIWSHERRQGVNNSTRLTKKNGMLCNGTEDWMSFFLRVVIAPLLSLIPGMPSIPELSTAYEKEGYRATRDGFYLHGYGGGGKISQIYVKTNEGCPILSDCLLQHEKTTMTLLVLDPKHHEDIREAKAVLQRCCVPESILSKKSIVLLCSDPDRSALQDIRDSKLYRPCLESEVKTEIFPGYNIRRYFKCFSHGAKYVLIRPDLIIFAVAKSLADLENCLELLKEILKGEED
jgi:2-polyprenyl-6-methoxyphenol hydroxylase-like FAD-dependent oxidoreductase